MEKVFELLSYLRDGHPHSGVTLARDLGITRAAVWNRVQRLQALGMEIFAVSGKGYRLERGFEFLDPASIRSHLSVAQRTMLRDLQCVAVTDSTNQQLLQRAAGGEDIHGATLLAEYQTAGRGRRGDAWIAPLGSGLCLSLGWRFDTQPNSMSALSLVVGLGVMRALRVLGVTQHIGLKWPNDLLFRGRKLAGILLEMRAEFGGPSTVVIGIGLNVAIPGAARADISQPVADLSEATATVRSRNHVAGVLIDQLIGIINEFTAQGFAAFVDEWQQHDALRGHVIELTLPDRRVQGVAHGVDPSGMLVIEHAGRRETFLSGHVRLADAA
jgi:BirA family biotin operon repressor/biotin-[acetyl-CoA-carboxylase] ligase